jgi:hypothetical protein
MFELGVQRGDVAQVRLAAVTEDVPSNIISPLLAGAGRFKGTEVMTQST